jgi:bifunctional non-homologous end joining protein LigD
MLAKAVSKLPGDVTQWTHEIKFDGYRCLALKDNRKVTLFSRDKRILNAQFPEIARELERIENNTMLDGEIVALDEHGRPSFDLLRHSRSEARTIHYYAFDMLIYKGKSLLKVPLQTRRQLLKSTISPLWDTVRFSEAFEGRSDQLVRAARKLGLEGIVAKRVRSFYEPGESTGAWVKYRINRRASARDPRPRSRAKPL